MFLPGLERPESPESWSDENQATKRKMISIFNSCTDLVVAVTTTIRIVIGSQIVITTMSCYISQIVEYYTHHNKEVTICPLQVQILELERYPGPDLQ